MDRDAKGRYIRDDQVVARCLDHIAASLDLIADVLADPAMSATERIRIAQDIQDRAGLIVSALPAIDAAMGRTEPQNVIRSDKVYSYQGPEGEDYTVTWEDDGGSSPQGVK
jgi:hypothetical protein